MQRDVVRSLKAKCREVENQMKSARRRYETLTGRPASG
jgi:hypothetical protein